MTAINYPGYFWDVVEKELYSIKIAGELKKMKLIKQNSWMLFDHYRISYKGVQKTLIWDKLNREYRTVAKSEIPYKTIIVRRNRIAA